MDWTIGTVAHWAGVHVETVRYYERIGLLSRPARVAGRVRRYSTEALERVRFIKRAQWLGFSLDEIAKLLSLKDGNACCETRALGETKLALLRRKRDELSAIQATLEDLLSECAGSSADHCPLLVALHGRKDLPLRAPKRASPSRTPIPVVHR